MAGYPGAVREQALRVVEAASPDPTEAFALEVRTLRTRMFDYGILSLNALPDLVFDRAAKEGWKRKAYGPLREMTRVAPLSVPLWAWLVREDVLRMLQLDIGQVAGVPGDVGDQEAGRLGGCRHQACPRPSRARHCRISPGS